MLESSRSWITAMKGFDEWWEGIFGNKRGSSVFCLLSYIRMGIHSCSYLEWWLQIRMFGFHFLLSVLIVDMACHLLLPEGGCTKQQKWLKQTPRVRIMTCRGRKKPFSVRGELWVTGMTVVTTCLCFLCIYPNWFTTNLCITVCLNQCLPPHLNLSDTEVNKALK